MGGAGNIYNVIAACIVALPGLMTLIISIWLKIGQDDLHKTVNSQQAVNSQQVALNEQSRVAERLAAAAEGFTKGSESERARQGADLTEAAAVLKQAAEAAAAVIKDAADVARAKING